MKLTCRLRSLATHQKIKRVFKNELPESDLVPVDHNDRIHIYKRENRLNDHSTYLTQYFFSLSPTGDKLNLTAKNLLERFSHTEFFMELKLFLSKGNAIELNEYGHLKLFDIINSRSEQRMYELLLRETQYSKLKMT